MRARLATFVFAALAVGLSAMANSESITFKDLYSRPRPAPTKTIAYGSAPQQVADLWLPDGEGPYRTLIVIHGGCWLAQLPGQQQTSYIAEDLRRRGYAVWNIDYRRIGHDGGGYPGTFLDTAVAIDKLRELAPEHKLDLRRVVAVGHSAGGHLATWGAARRNIPKSSPLYKADPLSIAAVVSLAGINDLKDYRERGPTACGGPPTIDSLIGAQERQGVDPYADTSPVELLPIVAKQVIVAGALDPIVPLPLVHAYARKAAVAGDVSLDLPGGHFELIDPQSNEWARIRAEIDKLMK